MTQAEKLAERILSLGQPGRPENPASWDAIHWRAYNRRVDDYTETQIDLAKALAWEVLGPYRAGNIRPPSNEADMAITDYMATHPTREDDDDE